MANSEKAATRSVSAALGQLDGLLGRCTMYRLVSVALGALVLYSIALDLLGWLRLGPAAIIVTLVLAILPVALVSWLLGKLFRAPAHLESSLITGALLYFLFNPTLEPDELGGIALASAIAGVSKFLLAFRGRHIFNPAALGAFVVWFTGLNLATWWVATPAMLWLVLPAAFVVLYRTGKLVFGLVFLLVSSSIIAVRLFSAGAAEAALSQPFLSLPGIFFVGFMLSEPLTLPPRKWQQLGLAVLVAVFFAVPYQLGPIYATPELALLIGNLLAFALSRRSGIQLRFSGSRELTPSSREYLFESLRPLRFRSGQYLELSLPHQKPDSRGSRRVFSLTTATSNPYKAGIGLRLAEPSSSFKNALNRLEPGQKVSATGVWGDFVLPGGTRGDASVLMLAGGVGVTPFLSQLRSLALDGGNLGTAGNSIDAVLLYTVAAPKEYGYREELEELERAGIMQLLTVCGAPEAECDPGLRWIDEAYPSAEKLLRLVPDIASRRVYISGSPAFVGQARQAAHAAGARSLRTDSFLGY